MYLQHVLGLFSHPKTGWKAIKGERLSFLQICLSRLGIIAAIPAVSLFFGITLVGWSLGGKEFHQVPFVEGILIAFVFYLSMIVGALFMAYFVFWLEKTYDANANFDRCLIFITYAAFPMYLAGLVGFMPIVWLCVLVVLFSVIYSVYWLYVGIPVFMEIPEGEGFMFSTSIIMTGLCSLVGWIAIIAVTWSIFLL